MKNVTKGECQIIEHNWSDTSIVVGDKTILTIRIYDEATEDNQEELEQEATANSNLIADAFNTHNATGYTPSELKQQKDELLEALNTTVQQFKLVQPLYTRDKQIIESATELITKYSNNDNT